MALLLIVAFLLGAHDLAAQRRGRAGGNAGPGKAAPDGMPEVTDFERQLEIQATPDQFSQFNLLSQSIEAAGHRVQAFMKLAGAESHPTDYVLQVIGLRDLLEKAEDDSEIFLGSFSAKQKSRLKAPSKKMVKAEADLSKHITVLDQEAEQPALDREHLVRLTEDLEKSLANLKTEQMHLGKLMGIPEGT
jgi:hypothetical protein